jgi:hypothetical protein
MGARRERRVSPNGRFRAVAVREVWGSRFDPGGRQYVHHVYAVCDNADDAVEAIQNPPEHLRYALPRYLAGPGGRSGVVKTRTHGRWGFRGRVPRGKLTRVWPERTA